MPLREPTAIARVAFRRDWRYRGTMRQPCFIFCWMTFAGFGCAPSVDAFKHWSDPSGDGPQENYEPIEHPEPDTADTADTGEPPFVLDVDCDALPAAVSEFRILDGARGYHGLAFSEDGAIVGWDGRSAVVKATAAGDSSVFVPGINSMEQLVRHPNGNYYFVDAWSGSVFSISPTGGQERVAGGFNYGLPYGIMVGPDGHLYIADGRVVRLDLETLETTVLLDPPGGGWWYAHATTFNLDSSYLVVSTVGEGWLYRIPMDEDLNPAGPPEQYLQLPGGWQDNVAYDACGNLYVPEYYSASLYRIAPDDSVTTVHRTEERFYGHGIVWGTGKDDWPIDSAYLPMPYGDNNVKEISLGVPDGAWVRTWRGERVRR